MCLQEWFWRFKPAVRKRVNDKKAKSAEVRKEFAALKKEAEQKFSDAKAELGLWSDAGLAEGRSLFWSAFDKGKVFGRRQTFWDALVCSPFWFPIEILNATGKTRISTSS